MQGGKQEFQPSDFLTRAEKSRQMDIPVSDAHRVIVKPNNEALGFRFDCYKEQTLKNNVSKEEFNNTVRACNKICENVWRRKKNEEDEDYNIGLKRTLYIAIFFSLISFVLLIILIYFEGPEMLLIISVLFIVIAGVLTTLVVISSMFSQPKFIELEDAIIRSLKGFLAEENFKYKSKGLRWEVQDNFYWLEVHLKN